MIVERFERAGLQVRVDEYPDEHSWKSTRRIEEGLLPFRVGVGGDDGEARECIHVSHVRDQVELGVAAISPISHHLVLTAQIATAQEGSDGKMYDQFRFLCGRDERHLFVAGVPAEVNSIKAAFESLRPEVARRAEEAISPRLGKMKKGVYRGYVRQGEWFFIPAPEIPAKVRLTLRNEPISRGRGSAPHIVEELFRVGGTPVRVSQTHPAGLTDREFNELYKRDRRARLVRWERRYRDATVYGRGQVSHRDHSTIYLPGWHLIVMNTEFTPPLKIGALPNVFLD